MYTGIYTALITPFSNGLIDYQSLAKLLQIQVSAGIDGLILTGSTGEGLSLTIEEKKELFFFVKQQVKNQLKLIAGVNALNANEALKQVKILENLNFDGVMISPPCYYKLTQNALENFYINVHDNSNIPIILYNIPSRTGVDLSNQTIANLSKLERIIAIKEASGFITRMEEILRLSDRDFNVLVDDDELMLQGYSSGAIGLISVLANVLPNVMVNIDRLWQKQQVKHAIHLLNLLQPLIHLLFVESNPVPIKYIAEILGLAKAEVRLPLLELSKANKKIIFETVQTLPAELNEQF